ncbi:MAG: transposase [Gammaproteobacteria bacterium]|nr:transposase [Gammaproteobacteria bacterium]
MISISISKDSELELTKFREKLHASFPYRADALVNLIDTIAGDTTAKSPVELSLDPLFPRCYSSLYDAVDNFPREPASAEAGTGWQAGEWKLHQAIAEILQPPETVPFWLLATDVTPAPRPFAPALKDRGAVYAPNPAPGNKPVAVGHAYSAVAVIPEKESVNSPPWVIPLSMQRVSTGEKGTDAGARQLKELLTDDTLPFKQELTVSTADSAYSAVTYLGQIGGMPESRNLVTITRLPNNRVVYHLPPKTSHRDKYLERQGANAGKAPLPGGKKIIGKKSGRPPWFGDRFALRDPDTWGIPDLTAVIPEVTKKGKNVTVVLEAWHDMLVRGKREIPMHKYPFTLIRCVVKDDKGNTIFKRPMWLIAFGKRRLDISIQQAWKSYRRRYDIEHFFRFGKQKLFMGRYQTPEVEHEENWQILSSLAYVELWLAAPLAQHLPNPWESHAARTAPPSILSPGMAKRDFARIIRQIGTPAALPEPRGNPPGRRKGDCPGPRPVYPVIFKGGKKQKTSLEKTG